ncbi:MAG: hypothetical protein ACREU4_01410, partial [Burkholderiales bacterium]
TEGEAPTERELERARAAAGPPVKEIRPGPLRVPAVLAELAQLLADAPGAPRAALEQKIRGALKLLAGRPEHKALLARLELVEINLPNLK